MQCSPYFDKTFINVVVLIKGVECDGGHPEDILRLAVLNEHGLTWIKHQMFGVKNEFHIDDAYELYEIQGMLYIITHPVGVVNNLKLYKVVNYTMEYVQDLPIKPFEAKPFMNFIGKGPKDFIAIPALL